MRKTLWLPALALVIATTLTVPAFPASASLASASAGFPVSAASAFPASAGGSFLPHFAVVAADGSGEFTSVQAAVDAVPVDNPARFVILIKTGVYRGVVAIPRSKPHIALVGIGRQPSDVVITYDNANGTLKPDGTPYGTSGSASVTVDGDDFQAWNLTFENAFDEAAHPEITNRQAVAVLTRADRLVFNHVRFLGNQDTLYVNSASATTIGRAYFRDCYVAGDVDFIFGRGTAVFDRCEIRALDRGSTTNNGYVTAASTAISNPYGFLFYHSRLTSNAADGTFYLGRPWHPSNDPNAIAQVVIRESWLGGHIKAAPWSDFGTWPWRDARLAEYRNFGPGAAPNPDRPQLTVDQASALLPRGYLAGTDGWDPLWPNLG
jgi:pectinesterase